MAGLEVVVRPVVFPNIRPRATQSLPPQDDPEKGLAVIQGNPAGTAGMSYSYSVSSSYSKPSEKERRVDETRNYQKNEDGTVNRENFVDLDVANRITMEEKGGGEAGPGEGGGSGGPGEQGGGGPTVDRDYYYMRATEKDNIDIRRRNIIKRTGP